MSVFTYGISIEKHGGLTSIYDGPSLVMACCVEKLAGLNVKIFVMGARNVSHLVGCLPTMQEAVGFISVL